MNRWVWWTLHGGLVLTTGLAVGCQHGLLRKPRKEDCPPRRGAAPEPAGLFPPEPPRLPPAQIPLRPDDLPPPQFETERRNFRPETITPPSTIPLESAPPERSRSEKPSQPARLPIALEDPIPSPQDRVPKAVRSPESPVVGDLPPRSRRVQETVDRTPWPVVPFPDRPEVLVGPVPATPKDYNRLKARKISTILWLTSSSSDLELAINRATREALEAEGFQVLQQPLTVEQLPTALAKLENQLAKKQPFYLATDDPQLSGYLAYAYFRQTNKLSADVGQILAKPLGLPTPDVAEVSPLWKAIQR